MCGICGIFGSEADINENEQIVRDMMRRLFHRGPDDEGIFRNDFGIMGHRRLAIIDIEGGKQPMTSGDGRYTLVFNGEIYNYLELRQGLIQKGKHLKTFSDTEVLLNALIHYGEESLNKLNGMFAFALLDNHTGQWMLARDQFGIKPLYYFLLDDGIVFASEIKALFAHPLIKAERSWKGIEQYLSFQFCLEDQTLFKGVKKVKPGCFIKGQGKRITQVTQYWNVSYQIDDHHTMEYFNGKLQSLLEDSVKMQVRSDVPLGAYLSGGLDSSLVTILAVNNLGFGLDAFHGLFSEGREYDESEYARIVAKYVNCNLHTITPTAKQFADDMPKLIYAMDEPVAGPGLFPQYHVSKLASEKVKVVLGGQGGDEIFGGYARYLIGYLEQALKGAVFETQEEGKHLVTLKSIIPNLPLLKEYIPLMSHFFKDGLFEDMDARYFRLIDRSPDIENILTADALAQYDRNSIFHEYKMIFNHPDTKSYINKMTHFDFVTILPALLQVEDRMSMVFSMESRVPLIDKRIVELVASIPPPMKFSGGRPKHMLKEAAKNMLPREILERRDKMGFPVPIKEWMSDISVKNFLHDIILSKASKERGLFEPHALEKLLSNEVRFGRQLWGVLCLELWHQCFIDGNN